MKKKTLFIVEDDAAIRATLEILFQEEGYEVVTAEDGQVAVELLESGKRPSLILLDLTMPRMSGEELVARLRQNPAWASIAVIVWTASSAPLPPMQVTAFARKPMPLEELLELVSKHA